MSISLNFKKMVYLFAVLLAVGAFFVGISSNSPYAHFRPTSYDPGGTAAFVTLLKELGYQVQTEGIDQMAVPRGELEICFYQEGSLNSENELTNSLLPDISKSGGNFLLLLYPRKDALPPEALSPTSINYLNASKPLNIVCLNPVINTYALENAYTIAYTAGEIESPIAQVKILNSRTNNLVAQTNAELACNAYLDKADNSFFLLEMISRLCPSKKIILNTEFTRENPPTIFEALGPWAMQGWNQCLILMLVVAMTLGLRFGLPTTYRRVQTSSRTFADAISGSLERTFGFDPAVTRVYQNLESKIRNHFEISKIASRQVRDEKLPEDIRASLRKLESLLNHPKEDKAKLAALQEFEAHFWSAVGTSKRLVRRKKSF